jgi:DNA-directed RNA polymerase subunit M/transcription elongation factor TFIIS
MKIKCPECGNTLKLKKRLGNKNKYYCIKCAEYYILNLRRLELKNIGSGKA